MQGGWPLKPTFGLRRLRVPAPHHVSQHVLCKSMTNLEGASLQSHFCWMVVSKHLLVPSKRTLGVDKPCKPAAPFCRAHPANIFQAVHFVKCGRLVGDVRNDYGGPSVVNIVVDVGCTRLPQPMCAFVENCFVKL